MIEFFHNATVKIHTSKGSILVDPWCSPAYYGTWLPVVKIAPQHFGDFDYIWVSHCHSDHFDPKTLNYLDRPIVADRFTKYPHKEEYLPCARVFESHFYPVDHALVVKDKETVVHLTDCIFDERTAREIKDYAGDIDIALIPFTGAGSYPQCWLDPIHALVERERIIEEHLDRARRWYDILRPKKAIASAGQYVLCGPLAHLNTLRGSITTEEAADRLGWEPFPTIQLPKRSLLEPGDYEWWHKPCGDLDALYERAKNKPPIRFHAGSLFRLSGIRTFGPDSDVEIWIDERLFTGLLKGEYSWNAAGVGSCYFGRRKGKFDRELMDALEGFHA